VKAAEYDLKQTEQELIVRVVRAYMNVLRAQDYLDTSNAEVTAVNRQLEQVQQRFDVGLVAITDVLESQAAYDNALVRKIQADGDQGIFFQTLSTLTGITYEKLNRVSESLPIINPNPIQEGVWVKTAQEENLSILSAAEQLNSARRNMRAKRSERLPTVEGIVTKSHNVSGGRNFFGSDTTDFTSFGLQLSLPIYNGGITRSRVKQAAAQADQASELLNNRRLTVIRDTRNLYRAVATDVVRVRARLKAIKSSTSALEAVETGYEVGTRNVVDVLQAQQRLFASQFDYADSRYSYIINLMALKQAAGTLQEMDLIELNNFTDPNDQVVRQISLINEPGYTSFQ
jgi:outer membrane protein